MRLNAEDCIDEKPTGCPAPSHSLAQKSASPSCAGRRLTTTFVAMVSEG